MAQNSQKTILITGGAGFIGSHLVDHALQDDKWHKVICVDNLSGDYGADDPTENIKSALKNRKLVFYQTDIKSADTIDEIFKKHRPHTVVHLASKTDTRQAVLSPQSYIDTNITGTLNLLESSKEIGVQKFVFFSSSSVYGNHNKAPFNESMQADFPISPYGASKKAAELLAYSYHHNFRLPIVCLRVFNAYGERMRPNLVLYKWVKAMLKNEPIEMSGNGERKRDFTYVGDVVDAVNKVIGKKIDFEILNIGNSRPVALRDLLKSVEKIIGKKAEVKKRPSHHASVERTYANTTKAKRLIGWQPKTKFEAGIKNFITWFKTNRA